MFYEPLVNPLTNGLFFFSFFFPGRYLVVFSGGYLGLKEPQINRESKMITPFVNGVGRGSQNMCAKLQGVSSKKRREHLHLGLFCAENMCNLRGCLVMT